jgi:hypothetical protein
MTDSTRSDDRWLINVSMPPKLLAYAVSAMVFPALSRCVYARRTFTAALRWRKANMHVLSVRVVPVGCRGTAIPSSAR